MSSIKTKTKFDRIRAPKKQTQSDEINFDEEIDFEVDPG